MNSALQPQLLKLEEVFEETGKSETAIQECVGEQLKSCLNLTIGGNVQYLILKEQVLLWDRSQKKWATSMVASSSVVDCQGPMPMDVDTVPGAKGKGYQKGEGRDAKGK